MSDYRTRAVAQVEVNGNAGPELVKLKQRADDFRDAIARAYREGNEKLAKKLTRDLKATEKQIRQIQSQTANVEMTLRRLDKASPRELRQTLKQMEKDLQNIERGSTAWKTQTQRIKQVKAELDKVNAELKLSEGRWARFNRVINDWQMTIMGAAAAVTGLVMAGKAAVQAFADIDAEMASVRKFTGMTAEEVQKLNEEFKKIDTRTSREDLNKLAQEAGRLGLQSQQDVLGFVKAANQINVALDDLGEGATLTLSKLTDIFGDKERLGVEQSLLSVGSVINELSQNCTASAPYLAQFAQRMAGVGAQAKMTIPQIMGLAAVLDSQGQAVEMSATAVSKLIMDMFKQQDKVIKATGINAEKFKETLKRSTNEGLLMLIERLHELGNIDVLAPVFKDMGENGARAAQVISALAGNLEKVRWEQNEAAKAFAEATSVTKEYEVQNNTVQAQLDKARKGFTEMAAALGEKLMPVMRYAISGTSALMRGMSISIDFLVKYKAELIMLAVTIASYTVAVKIATIQTKAHAAAQGIAKAATVAWTAVTQLAYAAVALLSGNLKKATMEMRIFSAVIHASPIGLMVAAITAACAGLFLMAKRFGDNQHAAMLAAQKQREYLQSLRDVDSASAKYSDGEIARLRALYTAATNEKLARDKRIEAVKEMQSLYPSVFSNFSTEEVMAGKAKNAYDQLTDSIIRNARARAAAEKILENEKAILDLEMENEKLKKDNTDRRTQNQALGERRRQAVEHDDARRPINQDVMVLDEGIQDLDRTIGANVDAVKANNKHLNENNKQIKERKDANKWLQEQYNVTGTENKSPQGTPTVSYVPTSSNNKPGRGGSHAQEDKFKAEKEWREREEAMNTIAYRTGEKNFEEYKIRQLEIEVEFDRKKLANAKITADETIKINAELQEALAKQTANYHKMSLADEEAAYNEQIAQVQEYYLENLISREVYEGKLKDLEMEHLWRLDKLQQHAASLPGADESAINAARQAHEKYQQRLIQDQMEKQKAYEEELKKHTEKLDKAWDDYFVSDEEKRRLHYEATKKLIDEVFQREMEKEGYSVEEKLQILEAYKKAIRKLERDESPEFKKQEDEKRKKIAPKSITDRVKDAIHSSLEDTFTDADMEAIDLTIDHVVASFSSMYDTLGKLWETQEQMQLAALEQRYNREISMAEGNAYKISQLEKKKAREQAQIRAEAQKRQFAQQVLSAIAQTATAAINAYSSAAAIPMVGHIIAPIAAAMATAAGLMQVAVIKQQQTLSSAQGFSEGGFTPDGPADKPVGIVHAGEWVASQKLLQNPATRPAIDALEYAQRNNRFGSLRAEDVTRHVTAPAVIAEASSDGSMERAIIAMSVVMGQYRETIQRLGDRLDEPFVTVATVSGDKGIKKAQDEYQRLQNNSLPKAKRK